MPVVYDPVIAEAIEQYNERYIKPQDAAYLSIEHPDLIKEELADAVDGRDIRLIVVTDAEGARRPRRPAPTWRATPSPTPASPWP